MKTRPLLASLLVASLAVPPQAFAQDPAGAPSLPPLPVAPVPYAPSQPVPYPLPSAGPGADGSISVEVPRIVVGNDVVYLKGGGMIRGTLIESIPNDHATVSLATGQSAVIPWDRIERIDRNGAPPPRPAPPPPPARPLAPPPPPFFTPGPVGNAIVHLEADSSVLIERRVGRSWVFACTAPCDAELPLAGLYRVRGPGVRSTPAFNLNAQPGEHVLVDVNTASKGGFAGGIVLTSVGGFSVLLGALVLLTVASAESADDISGQSHASGDGTANTVGLGMLLGGAAAVAVGVIVLASNRHSKANVTVGAAPTDRPRNDAWLRLPAWRDGRDDKSGANGMPKVVGIPLYEKAF